MRTTYCGLVSEKQLGQSVTLMGWAHRRRDHGGVIFIDLRDREGLVQVVCDPDRAEMFKTAEDVRGEFCLKVTGLVRPRPAGPVVPVPEVPVPEPGSLVIVAPAVGLASSSSAATCSASSFELASSCRCTPRIWRSSGAVRTPVLAR